MTETTREKVTDAGTRVTYFQPFYNLQNDTLQGHEALVRHALPDGSIEAPGRLLAAAEAAGEMHAVDLRTLDDALTFRARFAAAHPDHHTIVSVNFSWDIVSSPLLVTEVLGALRRHRVSGDRLLIDVTAAIFRRLLDGDPKAFIRLGALQAEEVTLCLDRFTAADIDLLPSASAVPVDIIKLHPALVAGADRSTLTTIAAAVQDTGLPVLAAGVESDAGLDLARELGFEWTQGFHLGEPVGPDGALGGPLALRER